MVFEPIKTPFTYSFFHKRKNVNGVLKLPDFLYYLFPDDLHRGIPPPPLDGPGRVNLPL